MKRIMKRWDDVEKYVSEDYVIAFQETLRKALNEKGCLMLIWQTFSVYPDLVLANYSWKAQTLPYGM